jgi:putative transposase
MRTHNPIQYQKNCRRFHYEGDSHFLTFSCYQRNPLLKDDRIKRIVGYAVADVCGNLSIDLWAYVFMPEHVHLLIHPRQSDFKTGNFLMKAKGIATEMRNNQFPEQFTSLACRWGI